jgi:hypothetical protein
MPAKGHHPHWPDKAMFASIMLILAGTMGSLFEALRSVATVQSGGLLPSWLTFMPGWAALLLCLATLAFGIVSLRAQRKRFAYVGCLTGLANMGFFGLVPILSLIAVAFVVQAHREGEDLTGTKRAFSKHEWPDKALAASLFLLVSGVLALLQGLAMLFGKFTPVLLSAAPPVEGVFDVAAAVFCGYASWQIYHLRRPWTGYLGLALSAATMGFYVFGPLLAATTLVLLLMARHEDEFSAAA